MRQVKILRNISRNDWFWRQSVFWRIRNSISPKLLTNLASEMLLILRDCSANPKNAVLENLGKSIDKMFKLNGLQIAHSCRAMCSFEMKKSKRPRRSANHYSE